MSEDSNKSSSNNVWKTLEPIIADFVGKFAWLILIIVSIVGLVWSFFSLSFYGIIGAIVNIIFAWFWVKPSFSDRCSSRDWNTLLDDVLVISNYRFPWMLVIGIILEIFGYGWTGLFILGPAIVIIFFGPRQPYDWTIQ